jgi:tetratricopeptide (TPR) repeat protein
LRLTLTPVADISSRKVVGSNQQTYQRLKLALSLNLRCQVFIAVCDDLVLRDRIAAQLHHDLNRASRKSRCPNMVTMQLNLRDPNPAAQITRWLSQSPLFKVGDRDFASVRNSYPLPTFQFLGIEQLTRQPAAQQRRFLTYLEGIERSLSGLELSLLLWLPQPWFRSLSQSAPEFWRSRTGIFEFVGDPTPSRAIDRSTRKPASPLAGRPKVVESILPASKTASSEADVWSILAADLAQLDAANSTDDLTSNPPLKLIHSRRESQAIAQEAAHLQKGKSSAVILEAPNHSQQVPPSETATAEHEAKTTPHVPAPDQQSLSLVQQIEQLHQQQASPTALAEAYQILGNLYRDRIEQGDASPQNLLAAIQAYEHMSAWLPEASPFWADVLNDLGNLYWMLSRGTAEPTQALPRLQQAIQGYQRALTKINAESQTQAYAMIQNNLGAAYADLAHHQDAAENLNRSIQSYQEALSYRQPEAEPLRYASTQNNLGTTYWNLAQHQQPVANLKQSIAAYCEALQYYKSDQEPLNYAMLQNNLGTSYWNLAQHERPQDWLRLALSAYRHALNYRTIESAPVAFAATQSNLGTACLHMANHTAERELRFDYLQQAIAAYQSALAAAEQVAAGAQGTQLNFDLFATHNNLGLANYQLAIDPHFALPGSEQSTYLQSALHHHLQALQGWQHQPNLRQTTLSCIVQTVRACYSQHGIPGQNLALSMLPGHLLPEILPQL